MSLRQLFIISALFLTPLALFNLLTHPMTATIAWILLSFLTIGWYDVLQTKSSILRDYPVVGHMRYILRDISPEIHQYFVESNTDGKPFSKNMINLVNSRADDNEEFHPFGTERDLYEKNNKF